MPVVQRICMVVLFCFGIPGFSGEILSNPLNNPYPQSESRQKIFYSSFDEQPKTLDPVLAYTSAEFRFLGNIYEPPLRFDYFKRPYQLIPTTLVALPQIRTNGDEVIYHFELKPGIFYQPHPGFVKKYYPLKATYLKEHSIYRLSDFPLTATRELTAYDYVYQIKRLANASLNSPIYELMSQYIVGFREFSKKLPPLNREHKTSGWVDLQKYDLSGVKVLDKYHFEIKLKIPYQQFVYWLTMPFFSPIPREVDRFYSQLGMRDRNLGFSWYPVGTGAFMITENNPNRRIVLVKNPHYHWSYFPTGGTAKDSAEGYLLNAGKRLPLIDKVIYTLEKETLPRWNKFLQGYYDVSSISEDSFDQAVRVNKQGQPVLSPEMKQRGILLHIYPEMTITYLGFNMLDPIVGGQGESARLLRQAISIAVNIEEYLAIFFNNRGKPAHGPIPMGVLGYQHGEAGINPYVYEWKDHQQKRRALAEAKQLLVKAGYPNGIDPKTGRSLVLHYDVTATGGPDDKPRLDWMRKQFAQLGISLDIRATLFNRFQDKLRHGNTQIFYFSWGADYPDPENFLFLFYSKNGQVKYGGENETNYDNPVFDELFLKMKNETDSSKRLKLINQLLEIIRHDAPWVFGYLGESFVLNHQWQSPIKWEPLIIDTLQLISINVPMRNQYRLAWNKPIIWPIGLLLVILGLFLFPFILAYIRRQKQSATRVKKNVYPKYKSY